MTRLKIIFLITFGLILQVSAFAQQGRRMMGPRQMPSVDSLQKVLSLDDQQVAQLKTLLEKQAEERKNLRDKEFESPEDRKTAMRTMMTDHRTAIRGMLTEEQQAKFKAWNEQRNAQRPRGPGAKQR